ncbi:MAG: hypothetical protein ACFFD1_11860 [Candidatus Thorarchaeota archaeon]
MPQFCPKCKSIVYLKKDKYGQNRTFCYKCGPLELELDPNSYKVKSEIIDQHETIVIDRSKQLAEFKAKYGERTYGSSCPNCKSFYLTKHLMSTRGDEPGKTIWLCLGCGLSFRRPVYKPKSGTDKIDSQMKKDLEEF